MEQIQIDKENFEILKKEVGNLMGERCSCCETKITKDTFGLLAKEVTSCKHPVCLTYALDKLGELRD